MTGVQTCALPILLSQQRLVSRFAKKPARVARVARTVTAVSAGAGRVAAVSTRAGQTTQRTAPKVAHTNYQRTTQKTNVVEVAPQQTRTMGTTMAVAEAAPKFDFNLKFGMGPLALLAIAAFMLAREAAEAEGKRYPTGYQKGHCPRPDLPFFSIDDVKAHSFIEDRLWVTYKGGIYDVTDMCSGHPGGLGRIKMAGGNDVSIFWDIYPMHYRSKVYDFVEKYRIGNLTPEDAIAMECEFEFGDYYTNDPERDPDLLKTTERPFCGEPRLNRLAESFYTPNELHYVRLHLAVPDIKKEDWSVTVRGTGVKKTTFTLKDIQSKFQHHTFACTLQCAGNRREEFNREGKHVMISPNWRVSAISNAKYTGVYLRDVLDYCGLDVDAYIDAEKYPVHEGIRHVQYESYDCSETGFTYGISIPIEKAMDRRGDCMLVWEMNGLDLPRDHGAPVRMLSPGFVGNKSAKFVSDIILSDVISVKPWHLKAYRNFPPDMSFEDHLSEWNKLTEHQLGLGPICYGMPVQSIISEPSPLASLSGQCDSVYVKGVSWVGNGIGIGRVDVSLDGGKHFTGADLLEKPADVVEREIWNRKWSWSLFEKNIPLPDDLKAKLKRGEEVHLNLVSKALDNCWNSQPSEMQPYWNPRGCVINNWYHVPVTLDPKLPKGKVIELTGPEHENPPSGGVFGKKWEGHGWTCKEVQWHRDVVAKHKRN